MKNVSLSKKIIFYILVTVIVNVVTLIFWFNFKIKPVFNEMNTLKEKLAKEEIKSYYPNTETLLFKLNSIAKEYGVKFKLSDIDNKDVMQDNVKDELFLFSDIVEVGDNFYLLSVYMNKNVSTSGMITGLILFQIALVSIIMAFIFIFVRLKLISPVENIVKDIRNYKLGKKPKKNHINGEIGIIQNEFVNLVDSLENEKSEQNRIIASISHDIKTPLTSIIGYSDLIKDGNVNKKEMMEYKHQVAQIDKNMLDNANKEGEFLGWLNLPSNYDKEEFKRIKKAADKIRKDSDILVVIGIGGSYLGCNFCNNSSNPS